MVWVEVQLSLSDQLEKHPVRWTGVSRLQLLVGHRCCRREDLRVPVPSSCCLLCFGSFFTVKNHTRHLKLQNTIHWEQEKYFKMLIKFNMHWGEKSLLSVDGIYYVPSCVFLATEICLLSFDSWKAILKDRNRWLLEAVNYLKTRFKSTSMKLTGEVETYWWKYFDS